MRRPSSSFLGIAMLVLTLGAMTSPVRSGDAAPAAPPAEVLLSLDLAGEIEWYFASDVGLLLVYGDQKLHRIDLLAKDGGALSPVPLPGLSKKGSVAPVPGTGILLVAGAPAGAGPAGRDAAAGRETSSYAVDTLAGTILWEAPPLPSPNTLFPYAEEFFVAYRSLDDDGHMLAVDIRTGKRLWEHAVPVHSVWTEGPYLRLQTGSSLWTVEPRTGEVVRRDAVQDSKKNRLYALPQERVLIVWDKRELEAFSLPPAPPAEPAPSKSLWSFRAEGFVLEACIKMGQCEIDRIAPDRLTMTSAGHLELLRISTGERLWDIRESGLSGAPHPSPNFAYVALPRGDDLVFLDGASGRELRRAEFPKGDEGSNLAKYARWLTDDVVMTVFPDKHGAPRRMSAFSASRGELLWTLALPKGPDFKLTAEQRGKLFGRILLSLMMGAALAASPVSVGGMNYAVVAVPNLDVSTSLSADTALSPGGPAEGGSRTASPYAEAAVRMAAVRAKVPGDGPGHAHYVIGEGERFEILEIDRGTGLMRAAARYEAPKVHVILPMTTFARALSIENDNRRMRILGVPSRSVTTP